MLGWLEDIARSGERFRELQAQGRKRISRQTATMRETIQGRDSEKLALKEQVEARIQELTRTKAEAVRGSIEKSIVDLGQRQKELEEKRLFADHAIRELESIMQNATISSRPTAGGGSEGRPSRVDCQPTLDAHRNKTGSLRNTPEGARSRSIRLSSPGMTRTCDLVVNRGRRHSSAVAPFL